ncbi:hypothetical protein [Sphingomonas aurantiaca]|uniref:hypothetical protein n=1 Tax=Sphingomonas aurantiaca TaxID=185949 RepID=UPI003362A70A
MRHIYLQHAAVQLGVSGYAARALANACAIQWNDDKTKVELEEGIDRMELMERVYGARAPCTSPEDFHHVRRLGHILLGRPRQSPPKGFIEDAFRHLDGSTPNRTLTPITFRALTGVTEPMALSLVVSHDLETEAGAKTIAGRFSVSPGNYEQSVNARLPEELRELPGTYLQNAETHPSMRPKDGIFKRLAQIADERLFVGCAIVTLRRAARKERGQDELVRYMSAVDCNVSDIAIGDPHQLRAAMERMLGSKWAEQRNAPRPVLEALASYRQASKAIDEYIETVVPAGEKSKFRKFRLPMPAGHERFFASVLTVLNESRRGDMKSRQKRIKKILDAPLAFLLVGRVRFNECVTIRAKCREVIDAHIEGGARLTTPKTFQLPYVARDIDNQFRSVHQTAHFKLWTWDLLHSSMNGKRVGNGLMKRNWGVTYSGSKTGRSAYVVEFLGCTPAEPGGKTIVPFIAEFAESWIIDDVPTLDEHQQEQRAAKRLVWQMPFDPPSTPLGVTTFSTSRRHSFRDAYRLLRSQDPFGHERHVLLIAHEEFTLGVQYAHASVFICADAGSRITETLQAPSSGSGYEVHVDPVTKDVFKEYTAICKNGGAPKPFLLSPNSFSHLTDLVVEVANAWHKGKMAPPVHPTGAMKNRGIPVARYAFTKEAGMLSETDLGTLQRILYLGWHELANHDIRHLFTSMARRGGVPKKVRQELLHHEDPATGDIYGVATPSQVSQQQIRLQQQRSAGMTELLTSAKADATPRTRLASRELARAEMNLNFYRERECFREATEMESEVKRWADELARAIAAQTGGAEVINADTI